VILALGEPVFDESVAENLDGVGAKITSGFDDRNDRIDGSVSAVVCAATVAGLTLGQCADGKEAG
jgi:hypothetical protein